MKELAGKAVRDRMRLDDLNGAAAIVDAWITSRGDRGTTPEAWSMRMVLADLRRLRGDTEGALSYLSAISAAFPPGANDVQSLIGIKKTCGYCLGHLGKYPASHKVMGEAATLARNAGMTELLSEVRQCQAMIFYLQRDYESSDGVFRLILKDAEQIGGWYFRANALWGIGKTLMIQGHHQAALPWLEESLALFESAGASLSVATIWSEMAVCHRGLGDGERSLELLDKALKIHDAAGTVQNYLVALANIGNVYLDRGDYLTAIDYYRRALGLAREIKDPVSINKWSHKIRLADARLCQSVDRVEPGTA